MRVHIFQDLQLLKYTYTFKSLGKKITSAKKAGTYISYLCL